jgi:hypothetical protein
MIRPASLIGGPPWLPVHCQVVIDKKNVFDFVPINATEPVTLQKLVTLQSVPALARARTKNGNLNEDQYICQATKFCEGYDKQLHLVTNNCWSFAFELIRFVVVPDTSNK